MIRNILTPKKQKSKIRFNDDLLKKLLLSSSSPQLRIKRVYPQHTQHIHSSSQKEMMVYNSSNNIPKFFDLQKNFNGVQKHITGKKIDENKYNVRIEDRSSIKNSVKIYVMTKKQVKDLLNDKLTINKKTTASKKSLPKVKKSKKSSLKVKKAKKSSPKVKVKKAKKSSSKVKKAKKSSPKIKVKKVKKSKK
tara:strand:- start:1122 stop:1697 length:576 start_codon:yes stop_codon:yes gene_type:complete